MEKLFLFIVLITSTIFSRAQGQLQSFPLSSVRLLDGPFKQAQQTDMHYMLSLDVDRLLVPYLKEAGLKAKAISYGNWENTGLDGHICGHYLSALSFMYASTGNVILKNKINYVLSELLLCQDKNGDGYIGGVPGGKSMWAQIAQGNIKASSFSLNGKWVPLYNIHKIYAGLYDAYAVTGNVKAKQMLIKLTDWCINLVQQLSDEQIQTLLKSEPGGLNEIFANVALLTHEEKYLELAKKFSDRSVLNPLLQHKDVLTGLHANTQIPKVIGFMQIAEVNQDTAWAGAANFFWKTVVENRTVAIGGNSVREHFHPINDFSSMIESREGPETCNSYNMLKLTKHLFLGKPLAKYMDYYERTLYNHILSSQNPNGGFVYFTPMRPGHYRVYSQVQESFWCCVGSGLENHGKYGELIYAHRNKDLFINLYMASVLNWPENGLEMIQNTNFPNTEQSILTLKLHKSSRFTMYFRYPVWIEDGKMEIWINGKKQLIKRDENAYVSINRLWASGDVIKINLPMHTRAEFFPDHSNWVAFTHGPIVLAAAVDTLNLQGVKADGSRMGHIASGKLYPLDEAPLIVANAKTIQTDIETENAGLMKFKIPALIQQEKYKNLELVPFYTLNNTRYALYFPYSNLEELPMRLKLVKQKEEATFALEQLTVDLVNSGEQQPESDHGFKGEQTETGLFMDRHFRNATGWFSYYLKNTALQAKKLRLTLYGKEKNKAFDVLLNGHSFLTIKLDGRKEFYSEEYDIPEALNSSIVEVRFVAQKGSAVANIYEVRLLK